MRSFFYNLDKTMSDAKDNGDKNLYRLCCDVKSFVCEGTFTNYKKAKTLMRYWGDSNSYVSKMTGLKESSIKATRRDLSVQLYELFGYDFFTVISKGNIEAVKEGLYRLSLASKSVSADKYLYRELIDSIVYGSELDSDIDFNSCAFEIQFLVKHSKKSIEEEMSMLDKNKLAYLIRMLDNEEGKFSDIHELIRKFERSKEVV